MTSHSIIKRLSDNVINQIKAGEVIERPLNVIKELVENAVDANATHIHIDLLDGGKKFIQISDNGSGISADQIEISTERHTTSKLNEFDDLKTLNSFGFRGEALASISSVSQFSIKTKTQIDELGTEVQFNDHANIQKKSVAMNTGTTITVKELFCNVPARLKFLRSTATEFSLIADFLRSMSLSLPYITFKLTHNGRIVFHYLAAQSLQERFNDIMGIEAKDYIEVNFNHGHVKIVGFTILPTKIQSAQNTITTFVNNRYIKDRFLRSSIYAGYQGLLMKGVKPSSFLFISMDSSLVDINAHPAKIEIRFLDPLMIQDLIARSIENALKTQINQTIYTPPAHFDRTYKEISSTIVNPISSSIAYPTSTQTDYSRYQNLAKLKNSVEQRQPQIETFIESKPVLPLFSSLSSHSQFFLDSQFLGQYLKCYLLFEKNSELWIVDQHAFHERILFEELQTSYQNNKIQKQFFLNPTILVLDPLYAHMYQENNELIQQIGFDIEILKNHTLAIHAAPTFLNIKYVEAIFQELSKKLSAQTPASVSNIYHDCFATIACHSAVRSGDPLSAEFVSKLMNRAKDVDFFAHCPHGRPVLRKFTKNDVERWFERI